MEKESTRFYRSDGGGWEAQRAIGHIAGTMTTSDLVALSLQTGNRGHAERVLDWHHRTGALGLAGRLLALSLGGGFPHRRRAVRLMRRAHRLMLSRRAHGARRLLHPEHEAPT